MVPKVPPEHLQGSRSKGRTTSFLFLTYVPEHHRTKRHPELPSKHALEATCIPETPERIVSLNSTVTDDLVALGLKFAAITTYTGTDFDAYEYMQERLE